MSVLLCGSSTDQSFLAGVSSFAQSTHTTAQPEENFEFKDNSDLYNDDYLTRQPVGTLPASAMYDESMMQSQKTPEIASRYSYDPKITHANAVADRYYTRHVAAHGLSKKQDFKVTFLFFTDFSIREIKKRRNIVNCIKYFVIFLNFNATVTFHSSL